MHQGPKFHNIILKWSTSQEQSPACVKPEESLPTLTFEIFNVLRFIEYHIIPFLSSKYKMILNDQLVGCDAHMERVFLAPALSL